MAANYKDEEMKEKVRRKLNSEKVKLWLPPYTMEDQQKGETPQELIDRYSEELSTSCDVLEHLLEDLRQHALEKLAAKQKFSASGVASLKVKLAGNIPDSIRASCPTLMVTLDLSLEVKGYDLKMALQEKSGLETIKLKLIAGGRVIEDDQTLSYQGVRNMSVIMCLVLSESEADARKQEEEAAGVAKTRKAAEYLSNYTNDSEADDHYYLQIADQNGKPIDLPNEERKALALAMTLHEKGRAAVKKKNYGEAVLLLLEADKEFKKCRADILNAVDNYALVCLDIVWCYLCLKNVDGLPDADVRLKACDDCFKKSYGPNLERLAHVKGSTGEEQALFMRLHLLQGILAYHQHQRTLATGLLNRASYELGKLQVDENLMTQVMEMGFSQQEARLGLRACDGQVEAAVAHIMKRKQEKEELKVKEKEEKRQKRISKKLGKTGNGEEVSVPHYESLLEMGFNKGAAAEALRQANNDIIAAIQVLQEHPELRALPDPDPPEFKVTDQLLTQVTAMGFNMDQARAALNHFHADVGRTIEELLKIGGIVPQAWLDAIPPTPSNSSGSSSPMKSAEEVALEKEAIDTIVPDLHQGELDHLDLGLEEEAQFLQDYMTLIASLT